MINLELQKENFKNHIAKLTDYGNIKIVDFKAPETNHYRIRFLFEEDYYRLHISGDLGELIASNYCNMIYDRFSDFIDSPGYFEEKIDCCSRSIRIYDEYTARKELMNMIKDHYDEDEIIINNRIETIDDVCTEILKDFDDAVGIGPKGFDVLSEITDDAWESVYYIGREETGILDVYLLAFELAKKQLDK